MIRRNVFLEILRDALHDFVALTNLIQCSFSKADEGFFSVCHTRQMIPVLISIHDA